MKFSSEYEIDAEHEVDSVVQPIYLFDPSLIATEGFSSLFISARYTNHYIKSLEKSKKGKI